MVADEIRGLADSSRTTADNIQEINKLVVAAVTELTDCSNALVEDINTVTDEMAENKAVAEVLHAETERFVK